ncbi:MAG: ribosome biogenesis/translation initiation ATPase RLI [Candidatus Aenigmatarchaeota archaeon]
MARIAVVEKKVCNPKKCDWLCKKVCPVNRAGKDCIVQGEDGKPLIAEEICIGCGICVKKCPFSALSIVNLPVMKEEVMHRFIPNGFCLFGFPVIKKGHITGLLGPNGIGKTTVLNIMAGQLKPNLGKDGTGWSDVLEKFKGTEMFDYMQKLAAGEIKFSYKLQKIDAIPSYWKGTIEGLLSRYENWEMLTNELGLDAKKDVSQLSGGELQLLAIAATMLKDVDFYFFDEPSSYLDVRQRLKIAKMIRGLAEKKWVVVVEHDLALLDYLADSVCILYGHPGAFGIVSRPYPVRSGINAYLEGYVKDANVRFRQEAITFAVHAKIATKPEPFLTYPAMQKTFPGFRVDIETGEIRRGEIIGILGPNATGKTTFIRMLAGEIMPDNCELKQRFQLAYKPQMIEPKEKEITVREFVSDKRLLSYLGLELLLERRLGELSGGELQAVMIAQCISQPKELMLLDEPSAFLDAEQRLKVAKLIRSHSESERIPTFVVDHDLLFLDAISDRLIVFKGESGKWGKASMPLELKKGMNTFLADIGITFRRDPQTGRPRANKPGSLLDREQKERREFYYL